MSVPGCQLLQRHLDIGRLHGHDQCPRIKPQGIGYFDDRRGTSSRQELITGIIEELARTCLDAAVMAVIACSHVQIGQPKHASAFQQLLYLDQ
jgi:hypothetical protein